MAWKKVINILIADGLGEKEEEEKFSTLKVYLFTESFIIPEDNDKKLIKTSRGLRNRAKVGKHTLSAQRGKTYSAKIKRSKVSQEKKIIHFLLKPRKKSCKRFNLSHYVCRLVFWYLSTWRNSERAGRTHGIKKEGGVFFIPLPLSCWRRLALFKHIPGRICWRFSDIWNAVHVEIKPQCLHFGKMQFN